VTDPRSTGGSHRGAGHDGKRVTYGTDAEMAAALADLDRKIAAASGSHVAVVRIASSKGV
jgi:hypothetical protein